MNRIREFFALLGAMAVISVVLSVGILFALAYPFMRLWNFAVVPVTGLALLDYWHAVGLLVLAHVLRWAVGGVGLSGQVK